MREGDLVGLEVQRWLLPTQHRIVVPEANAAVCAHLRDRKCRVESVRMVLGRRWILGRNCVRLVVGCGSPLLAST